ncbi:hypothetical protein [Microlunatus sp. Gsoil 973]|uniref:hypothetical protein n=1 Tax=Microlunatus sp. Gsoil 973 TaxID=2672569 RepID=UPI0012B47267|nr:hypothetical protein [Microlunatus sp. Gsoil 973]QGN34467.1 hypothetical protein GJV80_18460 [Microlunatus sp. Gsoil 973]
MTADGGIGFCHDAVPALLPPGYHGPLVVALDSNVLIDLQQHGAELINAADLEVPEDYKGELLALGAIVDIWMLRDIRFIVTPRSRTDAKRLSERFLATRGPAVDALAQSLAFQCGDWSVPAPSEGSLPALGSVTGIPDGADRDLLLEAQAAGAHVFLTRDEQVITAASVEGPVLRILRPTGLADELVLGGVQLFAGGQCLAEDCPYAAFSIPAPDLGKWSGLLSIFEES